MYNLKIFNGSLEVVLTGSLIIQDSSSPVDLDLHLPNGSHTKVRIKFEDAKDYAEAKADTLIEPEKDMVGVVIKTPNGSSNLSVVNTPLLMAGKEKLFLAIGWSKTEFGDIRFDYTFSATEGLSQKKQAKAKKDQNA